MHFVDLKEMFQEVADYQNIVNVNTMKSQVSVVKENLKLLEEKIDEEDKLKEGAN